jgi:hypothetical protein
MSENYDIDLVELAGSPIKAIRCYVGNEYGPTIKLSSIEFENGKKCWVEGEHDYPYLPLDFKDCDKEVLRKHLAGEPDLLREIMDEIGGA